jgi:V/A-type H+-transporting ATPase subunit I
MAVSPMRRVQVFAHSSHRASLVKDLQDLEIIHINDLSEQEEPGSEAPAETEVRTIVRGIQNDLSRLQSTIDYLADFEQEKGFIAGLFGGKIVLSSKEYVDISREVAHGEWRSMCNECQSLEEQALSLTNREDRLRNDREHLLLWSNLDVPIEEIKDTEKTAIRIGIAPISTYEGLLAELDDSEVDVALEIVGQTKTELQLVVIFLKEDEQAASSILTRYGFSPVSLPVRAGYKPAPTVADQLERIDEELSEMSAQRDDIAEKSTQLAVHRVKLMSIYDHLTELLRQEEIRESFISTDHAFMLEGWVRGKDTEKLKKDLLEKYEEAEIIVSEPSEDDEPPVDLEVRGPANPFQMVTKLYGTPNYREIDPTPLIAPFFAFFFGICITDAGYGLIVALIGYFAARKMTGGGRNLLRLMIVAGLATVLVGAVTGGWFGISPDRLPSFLRRIQLIDPQGEGQMTFLVAILIIGFIQVWVGFFVKMWINIRDRDWGGAFYESTWVVAMLLIPVAGALASMNAPNFYMFSVVGLIVLCCLGTVLLAGRGHRNPVLRLGIGGFELYSRVTGTFGDILSYLRLFALGLATGIIAGVVNTMAGMVWGNPVGKVLAIGILVGGHTFNLLMNSLGGFIHTARLQFVEFFTKFYEGGGEEFQPFKREHTYISVISDR